jgi:hypothetical protein
LGKRGCEKNMDTNVVVLDMHREWNQYLWEKTILSFFLLARAEQWICTGASLLSRLDTVMTNDKHKHTSLQCNGFQY